MAVVTVNYFSDALSRNVTYRAVIPEQVSGTSPLPSLYLLHGYTGDQNDWLEYAPIRILAEQFGVAVFLPAGENSFYFNHPNGPQFSTFIGKELVEQTRSLFPLSLKREDTLLAGLSMGGYGALLNGLVFPDTFGFVGSFSGVVLSRSSQINEIHPYINIPLFQELTGSDQWKDLPEDLDILRLLERRTKQTPLPHLFLTCGTEDYLYVENKYLHRYLEEKGISHRYEERPGEHDWYFWNQAIKHFLEWYQEKKEVEEMHPLSVKRAYEEYSVEDGKRILVDRLWPRGIKKEDAHIDQWLKEVAPSNELRKWFHQEPQHFSEFEKRYHQELEEKEEARQAVEELLELLQKNPVTLIYSAKDEKHNNAQVLQDFLQKKRGRN